MTGAIKVVDIFAGPGGLAEGFSAYRSDGDRAFEIALSVEKELSAFRTLRLRAFTRQFQNGLPDAYYRYIAGKLSFDALIAEFPQQWAVACAETKRLELGTPAAAAELDPVLDAIARETAGNAVLVGGPPCQAYSLVGRARNKGKSDYEPAEDHRHFLYREYIRIIGLLRPAVFVMENVKGFLSSTVDGNRIFSQVVTDLRSAGGTPDSYRIIPLVSGRTKDGQEYILKAEQFGVPQRRHRVILFGIRSDLAPENEDELQLLEPQEHSPTVRDVLIGITRLRSGLSKTEDSPEKWREAVKAAYLIAAQAAFGVEDEQHDLVADRLRVLADELADLRKLPPKYSTLPGSVRDKKLADWLVDSELVSLPNHEARGHMESDLSRYAFAAVFAEVFGRSPKASEFPSELAPAHNNWDTGKFADRFRVQCWDAPSTTITSHISKDGHYFIHPDPLQCRSLTVREAARLQTFPDNYFFEGNRTQQYVQVGNAVPPMLASQIAAVVHGALLRARGKSNPDLSDNRGESITAAPEATRVPPLVHAR